MTRCADVWKVFRLIAQTIDGFIEVRFVWIVLMFEISQTEKLGINFLKSSRGVSIILR